MKLPRIRVPWIFVLTYLAGIAAQQFVPLRFELPRAAPAGLFLMVVGAALALASLEIFRTRSALVTRGAYRLTRNPLYVGLMLMYVGAASIEHQLWPLLLLPLVALYIQFFVIPVEEMRLRENFGVAYERYCQSVPRWI